MTGKHADDYSDQVGPINKPLTAIQYVELIDEFYEDAKRIRMSRMNVRWGTWSRKMNIELNERIKSKEDPEEMKLRYVFIYWVIKSQLLELYYQTPLQRRIKTLEAEAMAVHGIILSDEDPKEAPPDSEIVKRLLMGTL